MIRPEISGRKSYSDDSIACVARSFCSLRLLPFCFQQLYISLPVRSGTIFRSAPCLAKDKGLVSPVRALRKEWLWKLHCMNVSVPLNNRVILRSDIPIEFVLQVSFVRDFPFSACPVPVRLFPANCSFAFPPRCCNNTSNTGKGCCVLPADIVGRRLYTFLPSLCFWKHIVVSDYRVRASSYIRLWLLRPR